MCPISSTNNKLNEAIHHLDKKKKKSGCIKANKKKKNKTKGVKDTKCNTLNKVLIFNV